MKDTEHSKLPWKSDIGGDFIYNEGGQIIVHTYREHDADFITRAVNSHEELVNFARQIESIPCGDRCTLATECIHLKAEAIRTKAEGRS